MKTATKNCSSLFVKFAKWKLQTVILFLIAFCLLPTVSHAQAGSLDTSFGHGGKVTTNFRSYTLQTSAYSKSVAIQSDGKIVVAGTNNINPNSNNSIIDFALVRYNTNGSLDDTFDSDGKVTTTVGSDDYGYSVTIQSDGKIVVAGSSYNGNTGYDFALVRYNTDGSLDNTFDSDGKVTTDLGSFYGDVAYSVVIQGNGKIIVAGVSDDNFALVGYKSDGSLDNTFGSDGKVIMDFGSGTDYAQSIAIQSDGKIVVAGFSWNDINYDFALARYNSDGSLDNTFDSDGKTTTDFGSSDDYCYSVAIQSDGKIVVAGESSSTDFDFGLVRYNNDGSLDNTFGSNGKVTTAVGSDNVYGHSVAIQSDGKIVVAGESNDNFALVRYKSDGSLDNTFDSDGKVVTDLVSGNDSAYSVGVQSDGKIVITGMATSGIYSDFALVRYNSNGSLDNTFDSDGVVITSLSLIVGTDDYGNSVVIQKDNKILVAGSSTNIGVGDFALVRYNSDGSLDNSFGSEGKVTTDYGNTTDYGIVVALQNDGKILVAGESGGDFALVRYKSDGSLDNSFDIDGKVTTDFASNGDYVARSIGIQNDGKIVVAGGTNSLGASYPVFVLARYNTDGSLDNSFGSDGIVTTDLGTALAPGGNSVVIQSDGKIVVAGTSDSSTSFWYRQYDFTLLRYNSDGSLDNTFGSNGIVITDVRSFGEEGRSVAIQSDGKIAVAGYTAEGIDFALVRYNSNGSLDNTFGSGGKVTTDFAGDSNDYGYSLVIQKDNKIMVAGESSGDFALARYNSDGSLDDTFGSGGKATMDFGSVIDSGAVIALQNDGKIVLAGSTNDGSNYDFAVARYNAGTLGVEENSLANSTIKVYPNPTSNKITLRFTAQYPENAVIKISDMTGKIVFSHPYHIENDNLEMDVTGLTTGIYLLNIESPEFSHTEKIVVAK